MAWRPFEKGGRPSRRELRYNKSKKKNRKESGRKRLFEEDEGSKRRPRRESRADWRKLLDDLEE